MGQFHFIHPLWLLVLPPLLGLLAWCARGSRGDGAWGKVIAPELLQLLRLKAAKPAQSPWVLWALVWTLSVLALASPSWQRRATSAFETPSAWVLVLDLSPTMALADVTPDRVTRARYAMSDVLAAARGARVGLVVFSGEAHTVAPLTSDVATVRTLLQPLSPKLMPESGNNVAPALEEASRLLKAAHFTHGQIVVATDGFADPARAMIVAKHLRQSGSVVSVIAAGTTKGAPTRDESGQFQRDSRGDMVMARLPADELQRLAVAGGGQYLQLNDVASFIRSLRNHGDPQAQADAEVSHPGFEIWLNGGFWLLPALLLLAAMIARKGWV